MTLAACKVVSSAVVSKRSAALAIRLYEGRPGVKKACQLADYASQSDDRFTLTCQAPPRMATRCELKLHTRLAPPCERVA
jgi:hypothetical protein